MKTNIVINSDPVKSEHVTWIVKESIGNNSSITLTEIVKNYYIHPNSSGYAYICQLEEKIPQESSFKRTNVSRISHLLQLEAALVTVSKLEKETHFEIKNVDDKFWENKS